ncbi:MAG TPA: putative lipid II flippase FtsW [Candidatus Wirthbacteria bacterium]|nr:putative lipid II flippase FtsW [Candidatus Wirthbacteria bacterium]
MPTHKSVVKRNEQPAGWFDRPLLITWMILIGFGLIMIASASSIKAHNEFIKPSGAPDNYWYLTRQVMWIGVSSIGLWFFANFNYQRLRYLAFPALIMVMGLLAAVFLPIIGGQKVLGARRWLNLGPLYLQPSEVTKLVLAVYLATWLERKGKEVKDFKYGFLPFVSILGVIITLLYFQEDLGTTIVICFMAVVVFYVSGGNVGQLFLGSLLGGALIAALIWARPFRIARVMVWLDPQSDPSGIGYHVTQSLYTIGSGGLFGVGYGYSRQKYEYLPHAPTDSIFAIICEELGFVGGLAVLAVYSYLFYRMLKISVEARDNFGRLLALSLAVWISIQTFINIGGLLRLIPLTGIPLPFISYGGSSLLMCSCAIGITLSISKQNNLKKGKRVENRPNRRGHGRAR